MNLEHVLAPWHHHSYLWLGTTFPRVNFPYGSRLKLTKRNLREIGKAKEKQRWLPQDVVMVIHEENQQGYMPGASQHVLPLFSFCIQLVFLTASPSDQHQPQLPTRHLNVSCQSDRFHRDNTFHRGSNSCICLHEHLLWNPTAAARHT